MTERRAPEPEAFAASVRDHMQARDWSDLADTTGIPTDQLLAELVDEPKSLTYFTSVRVASALGIPQWVAA